MAPTTFQIYVARSSRKMTQGQAAHVIGASARAWADWERGRRNMPSAKWELFNIKVTSCSVQSQAVKET